jgi:hypothetical protein
LKNLPGEYDEEIAELPKRTSPLVITLTFTPGVRDLSSQVLLMSNCTDKSRDFTKMKLDEMTPTEAAAYVAIEAVKNLKGVIAKERELFSEYEDEISFIEGNEFYH